MNFVLTLFLMSPFLLLNARADIGLNIEEINAKNAAEINADSAADHSRRMDSLAGILKNGILRYPESSIKKVFPKRNLTDAEFEQSKLLKCVDKIVKKNKGGYEAANVAAKVIMSITNDDGTFMTDKDALAQKTTECWNVYNSLFNFSDSALDKDKVNDTYAYLPQKTAKEFVASAWAKRFHSTNAKMCELRGFKVEAAVLVGMSGGVNAVTCLMEDGSVKKYAGPKIGFIFGIGARLALAEETNINNTDIHTGTVFEAHATDNGSDNRGVAVVGIVTIIDNHYSNYTDNYETGTNIGLSFSGPEVEFGVGLRFFNGFRRWDYLFNLHNLALQSYNENNKSSKE